MVDRSDPEPTEASVRRALGRAATGRALDADEAGALLAARGQMLDELLRIAGEVRDAGLRDAGRPGVVTYSKKVFIPLTRLCRDRCHYCTFATVPHRLPAAYLERDEVLAIAREGAAQGCKEALFTLGDRPEERWPAARRWLDERGYDSTLDYLRACAVAVLEETGLLPHLNPGVLSWSELQRLKPVAPSMGMMLETTATRLWSEPGGPHFGSPDKEPAVRLRVLDDAGRVGVPFTTGILIGIGENRAERVDAIFAIRRAMREYGHLQEVIVQNFRAKPDTAMRGMPDAELHDLAATVAVARVLLGPKARIQAPPNLIAGEYDLLLRAGIDDWGGVSPVTPDHVNPERPWPHLEELAARTASAGFTLRERLTVYPEYVRAGGPWLDPRLLPHVTALADPATGLAVEEARPVGQPWQEPEETYGGRTDLHATIDVTGRTEDRRGDFDSVYGDWAEVAGKVAPQARAGVPLAGGADADLRAGLRLAADDPAALLTPAHEAKALALFGADGPALDELCRLADDARRDAVGDDVTYVVNRNINFTNVCYVGCRFCAFAQRESDADAFRLSLEQVADRAEEAWTAGATEVCLQGGIDPKMPVTGYADIVRAIKERVPGMHVHAFSPMEIVTAAAKAGVPVREWLLQLREAGLDTIPGTAAEILDDDVRWVLTKGKLPAAAWVEVVSTAHELGIRSSSTMMYGHVDHPGQWLAHFRVLAGVQDRTGGFTEFVALPFVHTNAPIYLAGIARPGPTWRENRAVHAMARLLLHGRIGNIQCSWVKLGDEGTVAMLRGGCNDLGGTLMEETISRMAGSGNGSARTEEQLRAIATAAGRPFRKRTTAYGHAGA
ncbi:MULTISPECIES: bifunctional FO biosynthesis protein CofGH [Micromonospora]|uniref:bifunctional FO biosynthesis protein CofGH n=1 Tax=Micromonospora TaxID=1873 RepID=UPI001125F578|nr:MULTISPECIES: bifunctional FO biosynthesis protein CofGH [unclassified Micromonospora]MCK1808335.1 bifunctional FO biosynthesis protein CofGH [Micromonospora sp. R42106]MCK1835078.1 bifunctional FO biosynthesis protein CofGH [Micromonospora sp. R42003]MCK1847016.1 bifunctional FO biosynthesis protein CofGH [Micromonospora sp. R42004]MCM1015690.1 bifunctional FO biosynthesis protein CofGH [Micromonospora sp. XM-20-01]